MLAPYVVFLALMTFPLIGWVAQSATYVAYESLPNSLLEPRLTKSGDWIGASMEHLGILVDHWFKKPELCTGGKVQSDFNKQQCDAIDNRAIVAIVPILPPILILGFFMMFMTDRLRDFYRAARKKIHEAETRSYLGLGKVTQPPLGPSDFLSRSFCLHPVRVELPDRRQVTVLIPDTEPKPLPGQQFVVYSNGRWLGASRHIGCLHAPHMAVLSSRPT